MEKIKNEYGFLKPTGNSKKEKSFLFLECICICGDTVYKRFDGLHHGRIKSCGKRDCKALSVMKEPIREVYNYLTLTGKYELRGDNCIRYVEAVCVCGKVKYYNISNLKSNDTKSCGCKRSTLCREFNTTHGLSYSTLIKESHPIYATYHRMKSRCYNEKDRAYADYGGRGIKICKEWLDDFMSFYNWSIANGWVRGKKLSIDRFPNNDGNYEPPNCRWATYIQQNRNRRDNFIITAFNETKCLAEWLLDFRCNIGSNGLKKRLLRGWSTEEAITTRNLKLYGNNL